MKNGKDFWHCREFQRRHLGIACDLMHYTCSPPCVLHAIWDEHMLCNNEIDTNSNIMWKQCTAPTSIHTETATNGNVRTPMKTTRKIHQRNPIAAVPFLARDIACFVRKRNYTYTFPHMLSLSRTRRATATDSAASEINNEAHPAMYPALCACALARIQYNETVGVRCARSHTFVLLIFHCRSRSRSQNEIETYIAAAASASIRSTRFMPNNRG